MKRLNYIIGMILALWITSCVETFIPDLKEKDQHLMVINGTIISDSICPFWVSTTNDFLFSSTDMNSSYHPETRQGSTVNPRLWVEGSDGSRYEGVLVHTGDEPPFIKSGRAEYTVRVGHLDPGEKYSVKVEYQRDTYESIPAHPLVAPEIESINWKQEKSDTSVVISVSSAAPADEKAGYLAWQSVDDWEIISEYFQELIYDIVLHYPVKQTLDVSRGWKHGSHMTLVAENCSRYPQNRVADRILYRIPCSDDRISVIYSTEIMQRAISKEEFEYIEEEKKQLSGMGGIFTPMPSELPTNIRCTTSSKKALGFVGVAQNITHKRIYIEGKDMIYKRSYQCMEAMRESESGEDCDNLFKAGYQIFYWKGGGEGKWIPNVCLDVRARGASLVRPDFWAY